jgi:hypothetical protein
MPLSIAGSLRDSKIVGLDVAVRDPHRFQIHDSLQEIGPPTFEHVKVRPTCLAQHRAESWRTGVGKKQADAISNLQGFVEADDTSVVELVEYGRLVTEAFVVLDGSRNL